MAINNLCHFVALRLAKMHESIVEKRSQAYNYRHYLN